MHNYTIIFLLVVYLYTAFNCLTKKESVGKKRQHLYTKESREKLAGYEAYIFIALAVLTAVYALCDFGIIGFAINHWVYWGIIIVVGIFGSLVLEKVVLVKSEEGAEVVTARGKAVLEEDF